MVDPDPAVRRIAPQDPKEVGPGDCGRSLHWGPVLGRVSQQLSRHVSTVSQQPRVNMRHRKRAMLFMHGDAVLAVHLLPTRLATHRNALGAALSPWWSDERVSELQRLHVPVHPHGADALGDDEETAQCRLLINQPLCLNWTSSSYGGEIESRVYMMLRQVRRFFLPPNARTSRQASQMPTLAAARIYSVKQPLSPGRFQTWFVHSLSLLHTDDV